MTAEIKKLKEQGKAASGVTFFSFLFRLRFPLREK